MVDLVLKDDLSAFETRLLSKITELLSELDSSKEKTKSKWLTVEEATEVLKVEKSTLYNWKALGEFTYTKFGGKLYFDRIEIERKLDENTVKRIK